MILKTMRAAAALAFAAATAAAAQPGRQIPTEYKIEWPDPAAPRRAHHCGHHGDGCIHRARTGAPSGSTHEIVTEPGGPRCLGQRPDLGFSGSSDSGRRDALRPDAAGQRPPRPRFRRGRQALAHARIRRPDPRDGCVERPGPRRARRPPALRRLHGPAQHPPPRPRRGAGRRDRLVYRKGHRHGRQDFAVGPRLALSASDARQRPHLHPRRDGTGTCG
jgi:hypothetical protein